MKHSSLANSIISHNRVSITTLRLASRDRSFHLKSGETLDDLCIEVDTSMSEMNSQK